MFGNPSLNINQREFVCLFSCSFVRRFVHLCVCLFSCSFVRLCVCWFARLFLTNQSILLSDAVPL